MIISKLTVHLLLAVSAGLLLGHDLAQAQAPRSRSGREGQADGPSPARAQVPDSVELLQDIEYGKGGPKPLFLDVARPKGAAAGPLPLVVMIHGGGWQKFDKGHERSRLLLLAQNGFVGASVDYRLSGEAKCPAAIEDCKCAIRFLRSHASDYGADPDRIGVWGTSAGGHLAAMLGTAGESAGLEGRGGCDGVSSRVQAVVNWYGMVDLTVGHEAFQKGRGIALLEFLGGTYEEQPELYRLASPIRYITRDDPPMLLMHGEYDELVPLAQAEAMHHALQAGEVASELMVIRNAGHSFKPAGSGNPDKSIAELEQIALQFLKRTLGTGNRK